MNHPTFLAPAGAERTKRWLLHALLAAAALAWTVFVLAFYYSQLWWLLLGDWSRAEPQTAGTLAFIGGTLLLAGAAAVFVWAAGRRVDRNACTHVSAHDLPGRRRLGGAGISCADIGHGAAHD